MSPFFLFFFFLEFTCSDSVFGAGDLGDVNTAECNTGTVGTQKAKCNASGLWDPIENNCVLRVFQDLKDEAQAIRIFFSYMKDHEKIFSCVISICFTITVYTLVDFTGK